MKQKGTENDWMLPPEEEEQHQCYMCGAPMDKPGYYGCSKECKLAIDND